MQQRRIVFVFSPTHLINTTKVVAPLVIVSPVIVSLLNISLSLQSPQSLFVLCLPCACIEPTSTHAGFSYILDRLVLEVSVIGHLSTLARAI